MRLSAADLVVLDTETTGLRPDKDRLIEVAALLVRNGAVLDSWDTLLNPGCPLPPPIIKLTGLSDAELAKACTFSAVSQRLHATVDGRVVVAYNAEFDRAFLNAEMQRAGALPLEGEWLCPCTLARIVCLAKKYERNYRLEDVARRLRIEWSAEAHRARADAEMALAVLHALQAWLPESLDDIQALQRAWNTRNAWIYADNRDGVGETAWQVGSISGTCDTRHGAYLAAVRAVRHQADKTGWHEVAYVSGKGGTYYDRVLRFARPDGAVSAL